MPSTSISQPDVRRVPASRHRSSAGPRSVQLRPGQLQAASGRPVRLGPGGLAQRRAQLESRWRERLERVTELSLAYLEEAQWPPPGPSGTGTRTSTGTPPATGTGMSRRARQLARQAVAERLALAEIEAALDRIASGRYGWCEQCARPIAATVLTAQPQARYCSSCGRPPAQRAAYAC